ncbi:MAG: hypothetical protein L0H41_17070, partial [Microlunatus sp.]|nr:hypothetical protein [Microlunatus sp.]
MSSRGERRVKISRDKLVGLVVALACLAFSAIGLRVNDPPEFTYVDGVRDQPVSIEQSEVTVGEVGVGTRLIRNGEMQAETEGMFVIVEVTLAVPGNRRVNLNHAQLITKRRAYDGWSGATVRAEPGFQSEEQLIFEVDPAQIDDL